jgi:hypothetical protein
MMEDWVYAKKGLYGNHKIGLTAALDVVRLRLLYQVS